VRKKPQKFPLPRLRRQKKTTGDLAFVELSGKRFYLGRFGSPEAQQKYDRLVAEWLTNGRRLDVNPESVVCKYPADVKTGQFQSLASIDHRGFRPTLRHRLPMPLTYRRTLAGKGGVSEMNLAEELCGVAIVVLQKSDQPFATADVAALRRRSWSSIKRLSSP